MFVEHRAKGGKRNKNKKGKSKAKAKGIKIRKARVPTLWDQRAEGTVKSKGRSLCLFLFFPLLLPLKKQRKKRIKIRIKTRLEQR
jgi:hypothetical protein